MSGIVLLVHGSTSQNDILEITGCAKDVALGVSKERWCITSL